MSSPKRVRQMDLNENLIKVFDSIKQAEEETGVWDSGIINCCRGKYKQAGGFKWGYNDIILKSDPLDKLLDFI